MKTAFLISLLVSIGLVASYRLGHWQGFGEGGQAALSEQWYGVWNFAKSDVFAFPSSCTIVTNGNFIEVIIPQ